jgi:predicted DNA-binding transcriptional regulator AlpA
MTALLVKLLRIAEVEAASGLDRSTIYRLMKDEKSGFPEPIQLTPGGRAVAWNSAELAAWIEERTTKGREAWQASRPKAQALARKRRAGKADGSKLAGGVA